jgi:hypothetical protein
MGLNRDSHDETGRPGRKRLSSFVKAMIWTSIPLLLISAVSTVAAIIATQGRGFGEPGTGIGGLLFGVAILAAVAFLIARKGQIAAGIFAGAGIGLVGLMLTCFTVLSRPAAAP